MSYKAEKELAKLLNVPAYKDGSGYDFKRYSTVYDDTVENKNNEN